jgi:hypothetical protein
MSSLTAPIPPDLSPACRARNTDLETVPGIGDELLVDGVGKASLEAADGFAG